MSWDKRVDFKQWKENIFRLKSLFHLKVTRPGVRTAKTFSMWPWGAMVVVMHYFSGGSKNACVYLYKVIYHKGNETKWHLLNQTHRVLTDLIIHNIKTVWLLCKLNSSAVIGCCHPFQSIGPLGWCFLLVDLSIWEGPASQPQSTLSCCKNLPLLIKILTPP